MIENTNKKPQLENPVFSQKRRALQLNMFHARAYVRTRVCMASFHEPNSRPGDERICAHGASTSPWVRPEGFSQEHSPPPDPPAELTQNKQGQPAPRTGPEWGAPTPLAKHHGGEREREKGSVGLTCRPPQCTAPQKAGPQIQRCSANLKASANKNSR